MVDEVFGRPQVPRWLGAGVPMPGELARRIFLFRVQAGETLRDGDAALHAWLQRRIPSRRRCRRGDSAHFLQQQETVSEIPTL